MNKIFTGQIKLNNKVRLREVTGDPYIFLNLQTHKLVIIPVKEESNERQILSFVVKKLKEGITFMKLLDLVSEKFAVEREEVKEGLKELVEKLAANDMLKVGTIS